MNRSNMSAGAMPDHLFLGGQVGAGHIHQGTTTMNQLRRMGAGADDGSDSTGTDSSGGTDDPQQDPNQGSTTGGNTNTGGSSSSNSNSSSSSGGAVTTGSSGLPTWAKWALGLIAVGGLGYFGYTMYHRQSNTYLLATESKRRRGRKGGKRRGKRRGKGKRR